jgi:hypothetical protein
MPRTKKSSAKQPVNPTQSTDAHTVAMPRAKKSSVKQPVTPPPDASLLGIAPELRNTIYHMVAEDIKEVSIIARKIGFGAADAEDRLWATVAKHPLSHTCSQLRQEFDPIHRRKTITTGVSSYRLEVANYDVHRLGDFARLLGQVPSFLPQIRSSVQKNHRMIRFQLDSNLEASLNKIRQDTPTQDLVSTQFTTLRDHFFGYSDDFDKRYDAYNDKRWSWWIRRCVAELNVKAETSSVTENGLVVTQALAKTIKKVFLQMCGRWPRYTEDGNHNQDYVKLLQDVHEPAQTAMVRQSTKDKLRSELKAELTVEIRSDVEAKVRKQLRLFAKPREPMPKARGSLKTELREELEVELKREIGRTLEAEIRDELEAQKQARRAKQKESIKEELRQELKAELMAEIRDELEAELRQQLKMKLRTGFG